MYSIQQIDALIESIRSGTPLLEGLSMMVPLDSKYDRIVTKMIFDGLSRHNLTDHAKNYHERYGKNNGKFLRNHGCAKNLLRALIRHPQSAKIAVAGYEMKATGLVRYVAYAYDPNFSTSDVTAVVTADTQYPPTKYLEPQILTTYRVPFSGKIKDMLDKVPSISYVLEGKGLDEYLAHQEELRKLKEQAADNERVQQENKEAGKELSRICQGLMEKLGKTNREIKFMFYNASGKTMDVSKETLKNLLLARSNINNSINKVNRQMAAIRQDVVEPEAQVNVIPQEEYDSLVNEFIELGTKKFDRLYAEYMPPEEVENIKNAFKEINERLLYSVPEQPEISPELSRALREGIEAIVEADDTSRKDEFHRMVTECASDILPAINEFFSHFSLSIELVDPEAGEEFFNTQGGIGVILHSIQTDAHVALVAINEKLISEYFYGNWEEDRDLLEECISDTLWHEAGHHAMGYLEDSYDYEAFSMEDEEDIVEEFAMYMTDEGLGLHREVNMEAVRKFMEALGTLDRLMRGDREAPGAKNSDTYAHMMHKRK